MSNINFDKLFPSQESLVKYIDDGNALDILDNESNTLLMYVCTQILQNGNFDFWSKIAMKMLEFTPAQINLKHSNNDGITALILVSGVDNDLVLKMLSFGPGEINLNSVEQNNKMNALMYCITKDSEEVALEMLDLPTIEISLQNINNNGYTPLMLACEEELEEVALTMIDKFPTEKLNIFQKNNNDQNAFDIALDNKLVDVYRLLNEMMNDIERNDNLIARDGDSDEEDEEQKKKNTYATGEMPMIPTYPEQVINNTVNGYDPFLLEERNIKEYLDEDKDNIVIAYEGKNYLISRSIIERQLESGIVFECLKAEGDKTPPNVVQNLPLFNIKLVGVDIPQDKIGLWPEFIYLDGLKDIIMEEEQYFSIIPLVDKMLISVISLNETKKWGTDQGSGYGALHCQNGQGGMAGIIVSAKPMVVGGKKRKTLKKRRTNKKNKRKTLKKRRAISNKKKTNKRKTRKIYKK